MPTTSNFGWTTPADTDLVKDGAAAIRTLGNGIDTSFLDLKGGTTGQVLSKASNTDLDFSWIAVDPLTILDAKGDLISATAADTPARLAVGTNGQYLSADSSTSTGLKWVTPASGGKVLQVVSATTSTSTSSSSSTFADTTLTATITPTSATSTILVLVSQNGCAKATTDTALQLRLLRGATVISNFARLGGYTGNANTNFGDGSSLSYLDSPATTSATTYKTQLASQANTGDVLVQTGAGGIDSMSTITLLEIGA